MADSDNEMQSRTEKRRKKKRLRVEMSALTDTPDRIAPVVGYFSSGYNPCDSEQPPEVRVFRHKQHRSSRLDLVVRPQGSNVEFVGKSYEGEAAVHQPCHYALGVLDKDTQTLKVVPIAANKIFRLEPRVMKSPSAKEPPEGLEEGNRRISDLTSLYGTKRQRKMDEEEKKKQAFILSYITHLVNFWKLAASSRRKSQTALYGDAINKYKIPRVIYQKFVKLFLDPSSNVLPTDKKELVIGYILVLTLFADRFSTSPSDIAKDLAMTTTDMRLYYLQLGCKLSKESRMGKRLWTLPVPLKFTELKMRRKQKR